MSVELQERAERAVADLESAAGLLRSSYFEALVAKAVAGAVQASQSKWLDRAAAAAHCRCSTSEIDRAAAAGVFKTFLRGGTPLFDRADLDAAIEAGEWKTKKP